MAKVKTQIQKAKQIEWTTRRMVVVGLAGLAFCLPFVGLLCMGTVLKLGWK